MSIGSKTAKDGFANERLVVEKFKSWQTDTDVQGWLIQMGYKLSEIEEVTATTLHGFKTDVQVQISIKIKGLIDAQNLQVKLVSNPRGFNQIDKRWVDNYTEMWQIPPHISTNFKRFTGELRPTHPTPKNPKRTYIYEFSDSEKSEILSWINDNRYLIASDILKGRGQFACEWMLVAFRQKGSGMKWLLKPINQVINHYLQGDVTETSRGSIKIGRITVQRKGGDKGKPTANMLQFKCNPCELFDTDVNTTLTRQSSFTYNLV